MDSESSRCAKYRDLNPLLNPNLRYPICPIPHDRPLMSMSNFSLVDLHLELLESLEDKVVWTT